MSETAAIYVRMDKNVKDDAVRVFENLGISVTEAITVYFKQVALKNAIPFELSAIQEPKSNFERVSEYKRDDLQKVLDVLPETVDELWVFGSAVTPYCRPDSDLDVCIVGDLITKSDRKQIAHAPRNGMDLLNITHEDFKTESEEPGSVFFDVKNKGLLIFRKGEGLSNE